MALNANHEFDRILYNGLAHYIRVLYNVGLENVRCCFGDHLTSYSCDVMRYSYGSNQNPVQH